MLLQEHQMASDEIVFKSKIAKMGNKKLIIIPTAMFEMLKGFEDETIIVSVRKDKK